MAAAAAVFSLAGCGVNDESEHHFSNKLYINTSVSTEEILFKASTEEVTESRELTIATAIPVSNTVSGRFVYEPELAEKYNMSYGKEALALPDGMVILDEPEATIVPGSVESAPVTIQFKGTEQLDRENIYVAPVHLVDIQGIDALGSKTVVYYVFRGASLINVVADIAENYFPVKWNSNVSGLKSVTVEALMRVRDFGTVGGKKGEAMSTLFGIEGTFLIRIGDAGFPQNQIQLVNPNGNFPEGNSSLGLPANKWVHVAAVWDATTGDRIIYYDGKAVASDKNASGSVSLTTNCYIGYAWNDQRWLEGDISELRVWSVQRTQEEIAASIYEVDPASEGLIAYWKFNEGAGNKITDQTGHGNDITANSDLKWTNVSLPE